ncbi:hypothetical protein M9Y10_027057 [Tritrichomonas musculus]|uniref:Uncharacterized protein n=1 Tax=Tritrichomonas musculus TaxID=1915356 RepID=A0ABR2H5K0_9EUKA
MKLMKLNTMLYDHVHEEMVESVNDFRADDDQLKVIEEQVDPIPTPEKVKIYHIYNGSCLMRFLNDYTLYSVKATSIRMAIH